MSEPRGLELNAVRERLVELIRAGDVDEVRETVAELHPSDIADLVEWLEDNDARLLLLRALPLDVASETLAEMEEGELRAGLLGALTPTVGADLLHEMADDDAADLIGELAPDDRSRILSTLPIDEAGELQGLLLYGEETAGGLMTTALVALAGTTTASEAVAEVRRRGREVEDFYTIFVVDENNRLLGTVPLDDLILAAETTPVAELVEPAVATVTPDVDQEEVGRLLSRYNLTSIPVVNAFDQLLGRITFDDVIDVIEAEQTEDILLMAGVGSDQEALRHTWREAVRARLPWLFVNLLTAAMAATVVYLFSETIENVVILAAIMPIIAGLGGNAGTQALAVTVRSLALKGGGTRRHELRMTVGRELAVGLVNGAVLGAVVAGFASMVGGDPMLGLVVLVAMWGNLIVAGFLGSFVPSVLSRYGVDPAVGSSMFVTPFTDLFGFLFLLGLASILLL